MWTIVIWVILGLYWLYWGHIGVVLGLYWGYIGAKLGFQGQGFRVLVAKGLRDLGFGIYHDGSMRCYFNKGT